MRRTELVGLQLADVQLVKEGARITVRTSKTDQEGEGQTIAIPNGSAILPVTRPKAWLAMRRDMPGPLFTRASAAGEMTLLPMSDRAITRIVQKYAGLAGLDAAKLGAHSLHAGGDRFDGAVRIKLQWLTRRDEGHAFDADPQAMTWCGAPRRRASLILASLPGR